VSVTEPRSDNLALDGGSYSPVTRSGAAGFGSPSFPCCQS
jgi:hypothetical protein